MNLSTEQINFLSTSILLSDIKTYINSHTQEFNEFLENEKNKSQIE